MQLSDDELHALMLSAGRDQPAPSATNPVSVAQHFVASTAVAVAEATASALRARMLLADMQLILETTKNLRREQRELLDRCSTVRTDMRWAVEGYAMSLRRKNIPPERALALLKTAVHDGLGGPAGSETLGAEELMRDGVTWGISAYFAA
jgi:hypothetical protein